MNSLEKQALVPLLSENPTEITHSHYIHASTSQNTRKAYQNDIQHFRAWGAVLPTTPEKLLAYLHHYAGKLNPKTLKRRLIAIKSWHTFQGFPDPTCFPLLRKTLAGIQKIHGVPKRQAKALSLETLEILVAHLNNQSKFIAIRNNALLQIGFFGAFRRSELAHFRWEHISFIPNKGIEILVPRSKTDQEGQGQICAIPYGDQTLCPVTALKTWQNLAQQRSPFVFPRVTKGGNILPHPIKPEHINTIVKNIALECNLNESFHYSAHSLRRGFATTASQNQAPLPIIMRQGRWHHERTVLDYIEAGQRFDENAVNLIFKNRKQEQQN